MSSYGTQRTFSNGIDPAAIPFSASAGGVNAPFLITAASVTNEYLPGSGAASKTANNQKLSNLGGSHHINLYSDGDHDLLNGAVLATQESTHGTTFRLDESGGVATIDGNWVAGNGSPGTTGATSTVAAAALSTLSSNGAPILSLTPSVNLMLFIIAELTGTSTLSNIRNCGFDLRGYRQDESNTSGAIGMQLGEGNGGWGAGCNESFTAPSSWDQTYREQRAVPVVNGDGATWATAMAINGTVNSIGAAANNGVMQAEDSTESKASDTAWTDAPADTDAVSVHLGEGADSSKVSFYAMGIRNYSAAITRHEIELVVQFMSMTGKLPPWWGAL